MDKKTIYFLFELAVRINVFVKLFIYGTGKIIGGQFYTPENIPNNVATQSLGETGGYDLAWTFFGYSKGYIVFIGISQLIAAALFLYNKTKLVGAALLLPILLNIIVVDYFYGVARGALFSACFYLGSAMLVLFMNRDILLEIIQKMMIKEKLNRHGSKLLVFGLCVAVAFGLIFVVEMMGIQFFGYEDF